MYYTSSYGMFFVGVALGGLVLLAIFSMLVMARNQGEIDWKLNCVGNTISLALAIMKQLLMISGSPLTSN